MWEEGGDVEAMGVGGRVGNIGMGPKVAVGGVLVVIVESVELV